MAVKLIEKNGGWFPEGAVPDFGSIKLAHNNNGVMEFYLNSADAALLETIVTYCRSGSTAYCTDSSEVYIFREVGSPKWVLQQ